MEPSAKQTAENKRDLITKKIKSFVLERDPEAQVYLFGSRARGDAGADSDWDFFVATELPDRRVLEEEILDPVVDILLDHQELVQVLTFPKDKWLAGASPSPIYDNVRREGVLV